MSALGWLCGAVVTLAGGGMMLGMGWAAWRLWREGR